MRDVLADLVRWAEAGEPAAVAVVARARRSAPRQVGTVMGRSRSGVIVGSVTGGCVESDVLAHADEVIAGGPARLVPYGIADADAFAVGLPCGGEVDIMVAPLDAAVVRTVGEEAAAERPVAYTVVIEGPGLGMQRAVRPGDDPREPLVAAAQDMLAVAATGTVTVGDDEVLVTSLAPRPAMYVFGAIDFASALATMGRFLGYRVTVCDPREAFLTPARFPDADELVARWPHTFLETAPVDARTAICVLTHDERFDVPALRTALGTPAGYIGAMGSTRTTARRRERLLQEGIDPSALERIHAPIGLSIGSKTPEEVAVAIAAQIIQTVRSASVRRDEARSHL